MSIGALFLLFLALFCLSLAWLASVHYLLRALMERHLDIYRSIGSPSGFDPQTTRAVFAFLFSGRPASLGDTGIRRLANLMRGVLAVFLVGAVLFAFLLKDLAASQPH